jgi:hypothetical protein
MFRHGDIAILLGAALGQMAFCAGGSELAWHAVENGRWAEMPVPPQGHTGFTLLSPAATGLEFTNWISEADGASNRVLLNGSGVAVGDFDNDGKPDIFLCGLNNPCQLYRNLGHWRFEDVTAKAGLRLPGGQYRGATFADLNGDGWLDLLVSVNGGGVRCFLNDGTGKFIDSTARCGTSSSQGSTTLALADVDGNGTLDLYVANYRTDDIRDRGQAQLQLIGGQLTVPSHLRSRFLVVNGQVLEYGEPDQLYLNDGSGRFTAVSWTNGAFLDEQGKALQQPPLDWGLTATFRDINNDGAPDLYVCNDFWTPDRLWINNGHGQFRAASTLALRVTSASSMGVDFADIDGDGQVDFCVTDMFSRDPRLRKRQMAAYRSAAPPIGMFANRSQLMRNTLFHNRGDGTFEEIANYSGLSASDWSWQPLFLDVDLDGYPDLIIPAGNLKDVQDKDANAVIEAHQHSWRGFTNQADRQRAFTQERLANLRLYPGLAMPIVTFRNNGDLTFSETTEQWGTNQRGVHQSMAVGDFDGDGDLDLVVNNLNGAASLYRNESSAPRIAVRLRGRAPNTQGIGAKVRLLGGAIPVQSQEIVCGGRYLSGSDPIAVFAAGRKREGMTIEVEWRTGKRSFTPNIQANRIYEIDEGMP